MTRLQPRSTMRSMTCLVMLNTESRVVHITMSQSTLVIFLNVVSRVIPALLARMSTEPTSLVMRAMQPWQEL